MELVIVLKILKVYKAPGVSFFKKFKTSSNQLRTNFRSIEKQNKIKTKIHIKCEKFKVFFGH